MEDSNLATSIHMEDKLDVDGHAEFGTSENLENTNSYMTDSEKYNDNFYYWKDYNVNVDMSELWLLKII